MNNRRIDLNLLAVLDVLLAEQSVSRVAERLHLTQPAVSHALARAREALDDPLLLRKGGRMVPTPKGLRLQGPLRDILTALDQLLQDVREFDPSKVQEAVHIGVTDYGDFVLMPAVIERLRREAPGIRVVMHSVLADQLQDDLSSGKIDMAVNFATETAVGVYQEVLFEESYRCLADEGFEGPLTLERYLEAPHVQVSYGGTLWGTPDEVLQRLGLRREVVLSTPHFMAAAAAVARAHLLMTTPTQVAKGLVQDLPLKSFEPPYELPRIKLNLNWHARAHLDLVQVWVRSVVRETARAL